MSETLANRVISRLESLLALAMTSGERDLVVTLRRHLSEAIDHSGPHPPEPATWTCGTIRWLAQKYEVGDA